MTEKEKMLAGELYIASDPILTAEHKRARALCYEYNKLHPNCEDEKRAIMQELLGSTKGNFFIEQNFFCDYGYNISIGENFCANFNLIILDVCKVEIGDNVLIGPGAKLCTASHPKNTQRRIAGEEFGTPIKIGDNSWLGAGVTVLGGVTIGKNCIIGAGSVVTKNIEDNSIAIGCPCKVLGKTE